MTIHRNGMFQTMELRDGVCMQTAGHFFCYVYFVYETEEEVVPLEDNLTASEKEILLESAHLFLSNAYRDFDDEPYKLLLAPLVLLGMRFYRTEFLPLILKVVKREDDRERILTSLNHHVSVEQAAIRLGKDLGMDTPEYSINKNIDIQRGWAELYKQYGEYSLEAEYSLTD